LATVELEIIPRRRSLRASLKALLPWVRKGSLAVLDQGLFAGSNFLVNVLLARWLAPVEYGAFAVAFAVFMLVGVLHTAVLTEPMLIFGPAKYRERFSEYLGALVRGHFAVTLPGSALIAAIALLVGRFYSFAVGRALFALAVAGLFILLLWLLRRAFYARLSPGWAASAGTAYVAILVASVFELHGSGRLTVARAFLAMATASFVATLMLALRLRPALGRDSTHLRRVAEDHWGYGRWSLATAGAVWLNGSVYLLVLPAFVGLAESGTLRALTNLITPASNCITALSAMLLPHLSRVRQSFGTRSTFQHMWVALAVFLFGSAIQMGFLLIYRLELLQFLYGGKYKQHDAMPFILLSLLPFATSTAGILGTGLQALERPDQVFKSCIVGTSVSVIAGIALAATCGVSGAVAGSLISSLATTYMMLRCYRKLAHE